MFFLDILLIMQNLLSSYQYQEDNKHISKCLVQCQQQMAWYPTTMEQVKQEELLLVQKLNYLQSLLIQLLRLFLHLVTTSPHLEEMASLLLNPINNQANSLRISKHLYPLLLLSLVIIKPPATSLLSYTNLNNNKNSCSLENHQVCNLCLMKRISLRKIQREYAPFPISNSLSDTVYNELQMQK